MTAASDRLPVIALDPSVRKGVAWAIRRNDGEWRYGKAAGLDDLTLTPFVVRGGTHAVIEGQYLGPNARTFGDLSAVRGRLEAQCEAVGLIVGTVNPQRWKSAMLTVNGRRPRTRKEQKAAAKWVASLLTGTRITDDDIADAVCIAEAVALQPDLAVWRQRGSNP